LLGALSLATDLAHQAPPETGLNHALLSVRFARHLGLQGQELSDVYYLALVAHLGCTSYAEEQGEIAAGDDGGMRRTYSEADMANRPELFRLAITEMTSGMNPLDRARTIARFMGAGKGFLLAGNTAICEVSARLGERLGVGPNVTRALNEGLARWDGRLFPQPPGDAVSLISRITHLTRVAQAHTPGRGPAGAADVVRKRRGGEFDPMLADAFLETYPDLFAGITEGSVWDQTMEAEPEPQRLVPQSHLEDLTFAIADFTDIKSPFTLGHSRRVGALAALAGGCLALKAGEVALIRLAGHVHDLGTVSVAQRVWIKNGPLNRPELDAVRLHAYHTERILSASRSLQPIGALAGQHHERMDGSGYHRGAAGPAQSQSARLLAASEMYQSLLETRSWRPAFNSSDSARIVTDEVGSGRLDRAAVRAVMEAAGQPAGPRRVPWPAGLTDREVDVLRLLAAGHGNRSIARTLNVSEATVRTHALNIYGKTTVHSRAGIGLFAIEHDLISLAKDQPNG
jgi:HD-GYP domain-containing protein (c-di-GMP phosphodiesterase class II)